MKQRKPMSRGKGFASRAPAREPRDPDRVRHVPAVRPEFRQAQPCSSPVAPIEKADMLQHRGYMHEVKQMPCKHCGRAGPCDFAHRDQTKGMGLKTDCREGMPLCRTCHDLLGSSGKIPRDVRRFLEESYGRETRAAIRAAGKWPTNLPAWAERD